MKIISAFFGLALFVFVLGCSDPNEGPADDLKITFGSDTAWTW